MRARFAAGFVGTGLFAAMAFGAELRGTVKDTDGKPIGNVLVIGERSGLTDADGRYRLAESPAAVSFRKDGFLPLTMIVNGRASVDAVLRRGDPEWVVQDCAGSFAPTLVVDPGMHVLLRVPPPVVDEPGSSDIDYSGRVLSFESEGKKFYLRTRVGPFCCRPGPFPKRYAESRIFTEREWVYGHVHGLDARGVATDGTRWRYVGPVVGWMISYEGAPENVAALFDRGIDSMCIGK